MQSIVSLHYIKTCRIAKQESFDSDKSRVFHLRGSARVCRVVQAGLLWLLSSLIVSQLPPYYASRTDLASSPPLPPSNDVLLHPPRSRPSHLPGQGLDLDLDQTIFLLLHHPPFLSGQVDRV
jgi:hypothetical protein